MAANCLTFHCTFDAKSRKCACLSGVPVMRMEEIQSSHSSGVTRESVKTVRTERLWTIWKYNVPVLPSTVEGRNFNLNDAMSFYFIVLIFIMTYY